MKGLTGRQKQALATKKRIKDAAYALVIENGFDNLTMNKIASRAGVSVGTLYHYYNSKEDLFLSSYRSFDTMLMNNHCKFSFDTIVDAIRAVIYAQTKIAFPEGNDTWMSYLYSLQLTSHNNQFFGERRFFDQYMHSLVQKAIDCGELLPVESASSISNYFLRVSRGAIFHCALWMTPDQITQITLHDLDIAISHYTPNHSSDFPNVSHVWFDAYLQWIDSEENA